MNKTFTFGEKEFIKMLSEATLSYMRTLNESVFIDDETLWRKIKDAFPEKQLDIQIDDNEGKVTVEDEDTGDVYIDYGDETEEYVSTGYPDPNDYDSEGWETEIRYDYSDAMKNLKNRIAAGMPDKKGSIQEESYEVDINELKSIVTEAVKRTLNVKR